MNYYNEFDPKAAAWLRELIKAGLIPAGEVDERSICDVKPTELHGYTQCHFFAGIGGWSRALQLAGWPENRPVWTGSCPCQPFSAAGKGLGVADERHLWPVFAGLIRSCKPPTVFGEQVASAAGRSWLAGVFADLEGMGYQRAGADLCAAGVGAPHIRQRLWWVAHADSGRDRGNNARTNQRAIPEADGGGLGGLAHAQHAKRGSVNGPRQDGCDREDDRRQEAHSFAGARGEVCGLADSDGRYTGTEGLQRSGEHGQRTENSGLGRLEHTPGDGRVERGAEPSRGSTAGGCGSGGRVANTIGQRGRSGTSGEQDAADAGEPVQAGGLERAGFWGEAVWHPCRDGKARRVEPAIFPLAHGIPGRVGLLRGAGNAIVPQVAAEFIGAFMEVES